MPIAPIDPRQFVSSFRASAPYIHAHRGRTIVLSLPGQALVGPAMATLAQDVALLCSLGVRLVIVHGIGPQLDEDLRERRIRQREANGVAITDERTLAVVRETSGAVRSAFEAKLSMGLASTPMAGARVRVVSGNFVLAQPWGVRQGIDHRYTGEVRRVDAEAIQKQLDAGAVVLLSPLAASVTGETFRLEHDELAVDVATSLRADKLVVVFDGAGPVPNRRRTTVLTPREADELAETSPDVERDLRLGVRAATRGVRRVHLIPRAIDGALLLELFTRDGAGWMVTSETFEDIRPATPDDVAGVLKLMEPLEVEGILVRRPRELLEKEIGKFFVIERDGLVIGSAALYLFEKERIAELAGLAVHPDYRSTGRGDALFHFVERRALELGIRRLFVLTTHASHWFLERGFKPAHLSDLPVDRRALYNKQRRSKVFLKRLHSHRDD